ncbi:carbohydrate sulfotransferase 14-like [Amphiura filiformis]|uniref:carbohydrate sulfotransferase 14-like n=1 Tax=Amphiura filiformis TaxID=82378 RepID=UPI003B213C5A
MAIQQEQQEQHRQKYSCSSNNIKTVAATAACNSNNNNNNNKALVEATTGSTEKHQWEQEQERRQKNLRKQCASLGLQKNITEDWLKKYKGNLGHILVSDKHQAMYCYVPKVSCTNWKEVFLVMNGVTTKEQVKKYSLRTVHSKTSSAKWRLNRLSTNEILHRLKTYKKFILVRNPFSRSLSTYRDKFEKDTPLSRSFRNGYGNKIHLKYGNHGELAGKKPPAGGYDVTFQEFIKYIGDHKKVKFNGGPTEHWIPMFDLCNPCAVQYDIIGHLETLALDTKNILEQIGGLPYMDLVVGQSPHGTNSSKNKTLSKYFNQLTEEDIEGIRWRYKKDFKIFGYSDERAPID